MIYAIYVILINKYAENTVVAFVKMYTLKQTIRSGSTIIFYLLLLYLTIKLWFQRWL